MLALTASGAGLVRRTGLTAPALLLALGGLVLLTACMNYANLATARSLTRAHEVGIRKAIGAGSRQIALQHLFEAALTTAAALLVALVAVWAASPVLEAAAGIDLRAALFADARSGPALLASHAVVTFVSAGYPALALARTVPNTALRARASARSRRLATLLVGCQFAAASFLLIVMVVTYLQNERLERTAAGSSPDVLVSVENVPRLTGITTRTMDEELERIPGVRAATTIIAPPWTEPRYITLSSAPDAAVERRSGLFFAVGYDFFSTYGIALLAGREFAEQYSDESRAFGFDAPPGPQPALTILDRTYAERLGFERPEQGSAS